MLRLPRNYAPSTRQSGPTMRMPGVTMSQPSTLIKPGRITFVTSRRSESHWNTAGCWGSSALRTNVGEAAS